MQVLSFLIHLSTEKTKIILSRYYFQMFSNVSQQPKLFPSVSDFNLPNIEKSSIPVSLSRLINIHCQNVKTPETSLRTIKAKLNRFIYCALPCLALCLSWMNRVADRSVLHFIFVIATINIAGFSTDVISLLGMMLGLNTEQSKVTKNRGGGRRSRRLLSFDCPICPDISLLH